MKKFLRSLIQYPFYERRGILILSAFIFAFFIIQWLYPFIEQKKYSKLQAIAFIPLDTTKLSQTYFPSQKSYPKPYKTFKNHKLLSSKTNPNSLNEADWISLGLSPKQAATTLRFKEKMGGFKSLQDLEKCFTIPKKVLESNRTYFIFPSSNPKISETISIHLNKSDSSDWVKVKGIGPITASRIIRFRNRLGAFHSKSQLLDVYGFNPELYSQIESQIILDEAEKISVSINYATYKDLKKLIYLSHDEILNILKHREKYGFFKDLDQLRQLGIINDEKYFKIAPYLVL